MKYFAYGSNMFERRLNDGARAPSASFFAVGELCKYKLFFHKRSKDGSAKCNIVTTGDPKDRVYGVIFDIQDAEIELLDAKEGVHSGGYYRREITVNILGDEKQIAACAYFANRNFISDKLLPYRWYKAFVIAGAVEHGLPQDYVRMIKEIPEIEDPDLRRREKALRLVRLQSKALKMEALREY